MLETIYSNVTTLIPNTPLPYGSTAAKKIYETYFKNKITEALANNPKNISST